MALKEQPELLSECPAEAASCLGALDELLKEVGPNKEDVEGMALMVSVGNRELLNEADLREFLFNHQKPRLVQWEWPAVVKAWGHASRQELQELIALDQEMLLIPWPAPLAAASRRAGLRQLRRWRPLRDERLAGRYLRAVEDGKAQGWHSLVYGLMLQVYSLPLRQGLMMYAQQIATGFIDSPMLPKPLTAGRRHALLEEFCVGLPHEVNQALSSQVTL